MGVRLAVPSDYEALVALNKECYPEDNDPQASGRLLRIARNNPCWVYDDSGIKASLLSEQLDQPYVWSVATTTSHRGRGFAKALLQEFERYYTEQGAKRPWLHVRVDNPAQKLYFDVGYRVSSFAPNVYGIGEHGLVMRKTLS